MHLLHCLDSLWFVFSCLPTFLLSVLHNVTEYSQLCWIQDHILSWIQRLSQYDAPQNRLRREMWENISTWLKLPFPGRWLKVKVVWVLLGLRKNTLGLIMNITNRKHVRVLPQRQLSITPVSAASAMSAPVLQEKTPSVKGVKQHLTGNNILPHGLRLLSYIHASEFGVHHFPSAWKPNATVLHAAGPWNPIAQNPKGTCPLLYKQRCCRNAVDGKLVSNNWACCYRQTVLLYPENVSRPSARQIQHDSGHWPPQGNIYQLLHLDPVALTLDLLPWHTPFSLHLLNLTVNDTG